MSDGLIQQHRTEYSANTLNFNQAANTVLATFFFPRRVTLIRYGIISEASEGLLTAGVLNLAIVNQGGATPVEITGNLLAHGVRARGIGVYKDLTTRQTLEAGELLQIRVDVDAAGTSTGRVWVEYEQDVFNGESIPSTWVEAS